MAPDTVWRDTADPGVLAALRPGFPESLLRTPDVLVIGGGVMGLAVAAMCSEAGLGTVVLIEREQQLAPGSSGGAAAALSPEPHVWTEPPSFVELGRKSLALYRRLDDDWGHPFGLRTLDWLIVLPFDPPPGFSVGGDVEGLEVLGPDAVGRLEPELSHVPGALYLGGQAHLHPLRLAAALASRAGQVATSIAMIGLRTSGDRVVAVSTSAGELTPGTVVFATGLVPRAELAIPEIAQRWVKGHMLATTPVPFRLGHALAAVEGLVIQLADGRLVCGGTLDEGDDCPEVDTVVVQRICEALGGLVPRAREGVVSHSWCCFRPKVGDGLPIIDRVPGLSNAWITAGHYRTGILMAPAVAAAIVAWIESSRRPAEVAPFGFQA